MFKHIVMHQIALIIKNRFFGMGNSISLVARNNFMFFLMEFLNLYYIYIIYILYYILYILLLCFNPIFALFSVQGRLF